MTRKVVPSSRPAIGVAGSHWAPAGASRLQLASTERLAVFETAYCKETSVLPAGTVPQIRTGTSNGRTRSKVPAFRLTPTSANPVSPDGGVQGFGACAAAPEARKVPAARNTPSSAYNLEPMPSLQGDPAIDECPPRLGGSLQRSGASGNREGAV